MGLYKLTLATIFHRKVWVVALLCVFLFPIILPHLTPVDVNPALLEPARAQAAWYTLWVVSILWGLFQAARFGDDTASSAMGSYFLSRGTKRISQMAQIWLACVTFLLPLLLVTLAICLIGALPEAAEEGIWIAMNFQYALIYVITIVPLILLAISLGSRFGGMISYLVSAGLWVYGMYGVGYLRMMTEIRANALSDWIYLISPHYHLSDMTPRLMFMQGAMLSNEYLEVLTYFAGVALMLMALSVFAYKAKPSS